MQVKLITPEKTLFDGVAEMVTVPGTLGEFGVLPGHMPFISTLKPGVITIELEDHEKQRLAVLSGIAEVTPEHCIILADAVHDCSSLSGNDAQMKLIAAKKQMEEAVTEEQKKAAEIALAFAEAIAHAG